MKRLVESEVVHVVGILVSHTKLVCHLLSPSVLRGHSSLLLDRFRVLFDHLLPLVHVELLFREVELVLVFWSDLLDAVSTLHCLSS